MILAFSVERNNIEICLESLQELLLVETVQILDNTIVVNDFQLALREAYCHEVIVFFVSCMIRIPGTFLSSDAGSSCGTVMSVSNIERVNVICEDVCNSGNDSIIIDNPESMSETVLVSEFILRCTLCRSRNDIIKLSIVLIGKEHRLDIGILNLHMDHTVIFLILAGKLVLLDLAL